MPHRPSIIAVLAFFNRIELRPAGAFRNSPWEADPAATGTKADGNTLFCHWGCCIRWTFLPILSMIDNLLQTTEPPTMPSIDIFFSFFAATLVFAYMPGPAMLYAAAQTIARGRKAGWMAALGIHVGGYAHVIVAAAGLALLFEIVPPLYIALKLVGAAYLVWLGLRLFLAKETIATSSIQVEAKAPRLAFRESITVEVLNPKTAIFYVAFLPQFTDAAANFPVWLQLLILGTLVNVLFSSADVLCVLLADRATNFLRASRSAKRVAQRIGGSILMTLGVNVALSRQ